MTKGKPPGDCLSILFYQKCWPISKNDISFHLQASLLRQKQMYIKSGLLTLIHKKGDRELLSNYRPIFLLYDLKMFTKISTKGLKIIIDTIVQEHQYAKSGSLISTATILLLDLYLTTSNNSSEAFFISVDFQKVFDFVDHSRLYVVLKKVEFPPGPAPG